MAAVEVRRKPGAHQLEAALASLRTGVQAVSAFVGQAEGEALSEALIQIRESGIDPLEAIFAGGVRRFDKSGEYAADGALSVIAWLKWKCKLSGAAAAERAGIARHLDQLPKTEAASARGAKRRGQPAARGAAPRPGPVRERGQELRAPDRRRGPARRN